MTALIAYRAKEGRIALEAVECPALPKWNRLIALEKAHAVTGYRQDVK